MFEYAAKKADPPLNSDWVMAFAFKRAYRETRWRLGVWGWFSFDRTEDEQLGQVRVRVCVCVCVRARVCVCARAAGLTCACLFQMIVDRCEADCMGPVYRKIPGGRLERKIREQLQKVLDQTVGAGVGAAWKAVTATIDGQKETLEKTARGVLGELFEKQAELKNKIKEGILGVISPPLEEISKPVMKPVCDCLMAPLVASYKELAFSFFERMTKIINDGVKSEDIKEFVREIRWCAGARARGRVCACMRARARAGGVCLCAIARG